MPDISNACARSPPCASPTTSKPPDTMTGPKYGMESDTPARIPDIAHIIDDSGCQPPAFRIGAGGFR
jgi:hypothetical protein